MGGLFYGLEIAKSGLMISQKQIELTGHNITNANTVGYTRQRILTASVEPLAYNNRFAPIISGTVGGGVSVTGIDQLRNAFLDQEYRRENASLGLWNKRTDQLEYIESLFNETSDNGISSTLAGFFDSLHELAEDPVSKEIRNNVAQSALKLTETFNQYYTKLVELQKSQNDTLKDNVDRINDLLGGIATYNDRIYSYELGGEKALDLRDKRNVLLDELSGLVNIDYSQNSDGHLVVSVNGKELVNHTTVRELVAVADQTGIVSGEPDFYSIYYEKLDPSDPAEDYEAFSYSGGELAAIRQLRDGNATDDIGIPHILDSLNTLARSIAKEINAVHSTGYTMPNGTVLSKTGVDFFEVPDDVDGNNDYSKLNAGNMDLSAAIKQSVFNIAASDTLIDLTQTNTQQGNNKKALELVGLISRTDLDDVSNFESYLKGMVIEIAIESASSQRMTESQEAVVENLDGHRQSISSVSIDEEMIQMVKFQHAYQAASRMITAIDEALDVLINKTGLVGR